MPRCFQLFPTGSTTPATLHSIDEAICSHLGVEVHRTMWCRGWYDTIGWGIAVEQYPLGSEELRKYVSEFPAFTEDLMKILAFLEANYSSNAWRQFGKVN